MTALDCWTVNMWDTVAIKRRGLSQGSEDVFGRHLFRQDFTSVPAHWVTPQSYDQYKIFLPLVLFGNDQPAMRYGMSGLIFCSKGWFGWMGFVVTPEKVHLPTKILLTSAEQPSSCHVIVPISCKKCVLIALIFLISCLPWNFSGFFLEPSAFYKMESVNQFATVV